MSFKEIDSYLKKYRVHAIVGDVYWFKSSGTHKIKSTITKGSTYVLSRDDPFALVSKKGGEFDIYFKANGVVVKDTLTNSGASPFINRSYILTGPPPFKLTVGPTSKQPLVKVSDNKPTKSKSTKKQRYYAIGDIHGELSMLKELISKIEKDASYHKDSENHLITLGDYVDRGPDSAGVVDYLMAELPSGFVIYNLKGNHEIMATDALNDIANGNFQHSEWLGSWLVRENGGPATLKSYGFTVDPSKFQDNAYLKEWSTFVKTNKRIHKHLKWFATLPLYYETPDYVFVHAGIKPKVPMKDQREAELVWTRSKEFFKHDEKHFGNKSIVHGHTPRDKPELLHNRINVDTGATYGNKLTCVVLESGSPPRFLETELNEGAWE